MRKTRQNLLSLGTTRMNEGMKERAVKITGRHLCHNGKECSTRKKWERGGSEIYGSKQIRTVAGFLLIESAGGLVGIGASQYPFVSVTCKFVSL